MKGRSIGGDLEGFYKIHIDTPNLKLGKRTRSTGNFIHTGAISTPDTGVLRIGRKHYIFTLHRRRRSSEPPIVTLKAIQSGGRIRSLKDGLGEATSHEKSFKRLVLFTNVFRRNLERELNAAGQEDLIKGGRVIRTDCWSQFHPGDVPDERLMYAMLDSFKEK